jgi:hypothetical protein
VRSKPGRSLASGSGTRSTLGNAAVVCARFERPDPVGPWPSSMFHALIERAWPCTCQAVLASSRRPAFLWLRRWRVTADASNCGQHRSCATTPPALTTAPARANPVARQPAGRPSRGSSTRSQ